MLPNDSIEVVLKAQVGSGDKASATHHFIGVLLQAL